MREGGGKENSEEYYGMESHRNKTQSTFKKYTVR
jgi:hypothetical protein